MTFSHEYEKIPYLVSVDFDGVIIRNNTLDTDTWSWSFYPSPNDSSVAKNSKILINTGRENISLPIEEYYSSLSMRKCITLSGARINITLGQEFEDKQSAYSEIKIEHTFKFNLDLIPKNILSVTFFGKSQPVCYIKKNCETLLEKIQYYYRVLSQPYSTLKYDTKYLSQDEFLQVMFDSKEKPVINNLPDNLLMEQFFADDFWVTNIRHKNATKQKALETVMRYTGIGKAIHIGDSVSDIMDNENIQVFAVNSAQQELKFAKNVITLEETSNPVKAAMDFYNNMGGLKNA